ncbi:hypothetical protein BX600DRAFT_538344 [Xylariales sp. PMI_506]|nr:hypothetical protein BX600DRAFT_538344 [Xylariales sp. PMI_506]
MAPTAQHFLDSLINPSLGDVEDIYPITVAALRRTLQGFIRSTSYDQGRAQQFHKWLSDQGEESDSKSLVQWIAAAAAGFVPESTLHRIAELLVAISYMRERGRSQSPDVATDPVAINFFWSIVYHALSSDASPFTASRSAQGFLWVPLCSLIGEEDGRIDELWRLHVWLPDGQRGAREACVHTHHSYGQSWVVAGENLNQFWTVARATDEASATHAEYEIAWTGSSGGAGDGRYKLPQVASSVTNTHKLVTVRPLGPATPEVRDSTYRVSESEYHSSEVAGDRSCATLFVFDSHRGSTTHAPVLGPIAGDTFTQLRDPAGTTAAAVAEVARALRGWEIAVGEAGEAARRSDGKAADEWFRVADEVCGLPGFPNPSLYKSLTTAEEEKQGKIGR